MVSIIKHQTSRDLRTTCNSHVDSAPPLSLPALPIQQPPFSMASTSTSEEKKLFIGNLSSSCDEYTLVKLFSRYGQISKLNYMFHTSGPMKGKPRGYAFVEFVKKEVRLQCIILLTSGVSDNLHLMDRTLSLRWWRRMTS